MLQLEVVSSKKSAIWLVEPVYTIGCGANDIFIPEKGLEEAHFQLQIGDRHIILCEMGPAVLPVMLNNKPCMGRSILKHGDTLLIGQSRIDITDSQVVARKTHTPPCDINKHWRLLALSSALEDHAFIITHNAILGRDTQCNIVLRSSHVSKQQARFVTKNNQLAIIDLGSSNGTFVNKQRIKQCVLKDGDHIMFGALPFKLAAPKSQPDPSQLEVDPNKTQLRAAIPPKLSAHKPKPVGVKTSDLPIHKAENTVKIPQPQDQSTRSRKLGVFVIATSLIAMGVVLFGGFILYKPM